MKLKKLPFVMSTIALLLLCLNARPAQAQQAATTIRWDIASLDPSTDPPTINEGGQGNAGAIRADGLIQGIMTIRGSGTFVDTGDPAAVTGGGNWSAIDALKDGRTSGTFIVESLVKYSEARGILFNPNDNIGDPSYARAGLATLLIFFDDGSEGTLTISARFDDTPHLVVEGISVTKDFFDDTPHLVVEGISVTKDFVDYSDMRGFQADRNMTIFHILP